MDSNLPTIAEVSLPAPKKRKGRTEKKLPSVATVIANLQAGMTCAEIARLYGVGEAAVRSFCSRNSLSLVDLRNWRRTRADLLSLKQSQMLEAITPEKMSGASVRDLAGSIVGLHGVERLERGLSTQTIDVADVTATLADLTKMENEIRAKLGKPLLPSDAEIIEPE